jgi:DHA1 family bicyclomycin/chloramphenicol resistance-like MFS transporter
VPQDSETRLPLQFREFVALMALLMSMTAMSIDIMLPALPEIGASLGVRQSTQLPFVVTVFMVGMAIGQLVWGPLADRFGRRRPLLLGLALFVLATTVAATTQSFSQFLAARFFQGIGGSVGRIIVTAIVRDLFVGRQMARVMSMIMMVFILVPMLAPSVGQLIILVGTWPWLFAVLLAASLISLIWASCRLPETQPPLAAGARRLTVGEAWPSYSRTASPFGYGIASGFVLGLLVAYIASAQQVFGTAYGLASCSHLPLPVSLARSRWPRSPTRAWSGASACGGSHIPRWSYFSLSAHFGAAWHHSLFAALAGARRHGRELFSSTA